MQIGDEVLALDGVLLHDAKVLKMKFERDVVGFSRFV